MLASGSLPRHQIFVSCVDLQTHAPRRWRPLTPSSTSQTAKARAANRANADSSTDGHGPSTSGRGSGAAASSNNSQEGASAAEQLRLLAAARRASQRAVHQATTVDARVYEQLLAAQARLNQRLSETNAHIYHLEGTVARCQEDLMAAHELLKQISMEFGTTKRLAQGVNAAVRFGVDPQDAITKADKLAERLATLEAAVLEQREEFSKRVVRKVPVEWVGVASEVRVMGDFDNWSRGQELNAEDVTSDSVYARFEGTLLLRPGTYRVKLLVDGQWRLASGWPTELDDQGNTVNVLVVQ